MGNTPIRLEISKIKVKDQTVTYKTNTRVEGTEGGAGGKNTEKKIWSMPIKMVCTSGMHGIRGRWNI